MRKMKKLAGAVLALILVLGMNATVFAEDTVVVENLSGHTFTAYQIFSGTQSADTATALGDIEWGSGIDSSSFLAALQMSAVVVDTDNNITLGSLFTNCDTAQKVANVLDTYANDSAAANAFAALAVDYVDGAGTSIAAGISTLSAGCYLVVDTTTSLSDGDAYNAALLQVTGGGTITIAEKTDAPTVDKSVDDADTYIGGTVTFTLTGSVPDMTYYDAYRYVFHDTLSPSLKYTDGTLKVYGVDAGGGKNDITSSFTIAGTDSYDAAAGTTITVSISDLKSLSHVSNYKYIVVEYEAVLQSSAAAGQTVLNKNTVYLEYSNNPDNSGSASADTGNTPTDVVYVFTYELDGTKADADSYNTGTSDYDNKLADAEFNLTKTVSDSTYYVQLDADNKVTGWTTSGADAATIRSGSDGSFYVIGLDEGTYSLIETKAPAGYNKLTDPITIVITSTLSASVDSGTATDDMDTITALTIKVGSEDAVDGTTNTGIVKITVENNVGATLPTTGGIGTTIFYIVGSVLVLGALVVLIARKRMNQAK